MTRCVIYFFGLTSELYLILNVVITIAKSIQQNIDINPCMTVGCKIAQFFIVNDRSASIDKVNGKKVVMDLRYGCMHSNGHIIPKINVK